jgi:hypothetical protein
LRAIALRNVARRRGMPATGDVSNAASTTRYLVTVGGRKLRSA